MWFVYSDTDKVELDKVKGKSKKKDIWLSKVGVHHTEKLGFTMHTDPNRQSIIQKVLSAFDSHSQSSATAACSKQVTKEGGSQQRRTQS